MKIIYKIYENPSQKLGFSFGIRVYTIVHNGRCKLLIKTKEKILYQFDIRCPCCNRKLMVLNLSNYEKPKVCVLQKNDLGVHNTETKCHICKSFVAIDIRN